MVSENAKADIPPMIMVMGVTGSGKSYFINKLAGGNVVKEGFDMRSCTRECKLIPVEIGNSKALLLDTPGFDDTTRTDSDILSEIATVLAAQYELGVQLKGIIFMQRITDIKMTGSSMKTLQIFKKIVGDAALRNVLLITSRWAELDEGLGAARERQLREEFWAYMLAKGSTMSRFHGDRHSAIALVAQIFIQDNIVLDLQRELVDSGMRLNETAAGSFANDDLEALKVQLQQEITELGSFKRDLAGSDQFMRNQVQKDCNEKQAWSQNAREQQVRLEAPVGAQVHRDIQEARSGRGARFMRFGLGLIPSVVHILAAFVGLDGPLIDFN